MKEQGELIQQLLKAFKQGDMKLTEINIPANTQTYPILPETSGTLDPYAKPPSDPVANPSEPLVTNEIVEVKQIEPPKPKPKPKRIPPPPPCAVHDIPDDELAQAVRDYYRGIELDDIEDKTTS